MKVLYLAVRGATDGTAAAFYGQASAGVSTHPCFRETCFGCIAASGAVSAPALFLRPGLWLHAVLMPRACLPVVLAACRLGSAGNARGASPREEGAIVVGREGEVAL